MKKLLVILCVVLSAGSTMAQSSIGHVNSQALLDTLPMRRVALKNFQIYEQNGMTELREMEADLNEGIAIFQKNQPNMSPVIMKIEQEKLEKKRQALIDRDEAFQQELQAYSQELNVPILQMVQKAVQTVSDRNKLDYVLDATSVLIANGKDITNEVITELLKLDAAASQP
ncbi:MAG: outer membrane protein [Crocinitomicaceae bacterium]|jgi:outer membrane protein